MGCQTSSLRAQTPAADNSKANKDISLTAENQANDKADRKMTAQIRKAILADKTLSEYAKNCKVITRGGAVTLRGPVRSEDEKNAVGKHAADAAGDAKVTNRLTVIAAKTKTQS